MSASSPAVADTSLRREVDHLAAIIDSALNAVVGMDDQGRITIWSAQAEQVFGRARAEVMGRAVAETIIPERMREAHGRGLRRYLATRESRVLGSVVTVSAMHGDGHEFPAELAISPPLVRPDGSIEFIAFVRDISERVRGERIRSMQFDVTRALTTSRTLEGAARTFLEAVATALQWPVAMLWLANDADMRLRQAQTWQASGAGMDALISAGEGLAFAPGEGFPGAVWAAERPISVGDFGADPRLPRAPVATASGIHAAAGFPITDRGAVVGVVEVMGPQVMPLDDTTLAVMMDLGHQIGQFLEHVHVSEDLARANLELIARATELEGARDQLIARTADLERSNTDLEQFARVASHDLQEPLRMVTSYVQLLARRYRGRLGPDADEYIDFATDGSTRMQALITDLLAYSRSGHDPHEPTSVDAARCVDAAKANLLSSMRESGAEVLRGDLPHVRASPTQLTQVFQNLIGNALKFRGQSAPRVEVAARREDGDWLFTVGDNGIGIEPRQQDRIFEVFKRLHTREQYSGTGIGLAVCKKMIERFGGRIWVDSEPGAGSTFCFTLPAADC